MALTDESALRLYLRAIVANSPTSFFFFSSRRRHTRSLRDWCSDVCSSDLEPVCVPLDIAAMARGTHTGSATPVIAIGGAFPMQIDEAFRKKINQDATAFLRSFTERRGRNRSEECRVGKEGK